MKELARDFLARPDLCERPVNECVEVDSARLPRCRKKFFFLFHARRTRLVSGAWVRKPIFLDGFHLQDRSIGHGALGLDALERRRRRNKAMFAARRGFQLKPATR
jgi:hypothetical protein